MQNFLGLGFSMHELYRDSNGKGAVPVRCGTGMRRKISERSNAGFPKCRSVQVIVMAED